MQRMKLYASGMKLDPLGSLRDRVFRSYLVKDSELEAKRAEFNMLVALTNADIKDPVKKAEWARYINKSWRQYLSLLYYVESSEEYPEEERLKEYYDKVVSKTKLTIRKDRKTKNLIVSGIESLK
jgi:hypothetical protein